MREGGGEGHERGRRTRRESLTESDSRVLLASPTERMALSTSLWPGRQFTHLLRA